MDKVVHFELVADDVERAKKFYGETFGWKMNDVPDMSYTMVHTAPTDEKGMMQEPGAINGGLMKRQAPWTTPIIVINVDDLDAATEKVKQNGGEVVKERMPVGEMGFVAYFKDPEGNLMGLWQNKK